METKIVYNTKKMKADIKEMVKKQKFYKNQRRTEKLVGERKLSPSDATYKHKTNREDLRIMYAGYGIARGKTFSQIENRYPEDGHPLNYHKRTIDRILEGYEELIEVEIEN